jgi:hypothetical protein
MKKTSPLLAVFVVLFLIFTSQLALTSCTKDSPITKHDTTIITIHDTTTIVKSPPVCNVQGTYKGTAIGAPTASTAGQVGPQSYVLKSGNLTVGYGASPTLAVTFGGYTNTCDSVIISSYYTVNSCYYLFKGAFNNTKTTLSGTYQNLTLTTDFGTFSFDKQ